MDLALNNLQRFICYKKLTNKPNINSTPVVYLAESSFVD